DLGEVDERERCDDSVVGRRSGHGFSFDTVVLTSVGTPVCNRQLGHIAGACTCLLTFTEPVEWSAASASMSPLLRSTRLPEARLRKSAMPATTTAVATGELNAPLARSRSAVMRP